MAKPELTKLFIAKTLKELMKAIPLGKIKVQDIVRACGLNRKTFYYHFHGKQSLICWIFDNEFASLVDLNHDNTILDELAAHLYENKDFYIAALTSDIQNNLREHLFKIAYNAITEIILKLLGNSSMAPRDLKCPV